MSAPIPSQFEQKNPASALTAADSPTGGGTPGAGYGYGYGNTVPGGESEFSLVHYLQILYRRRYIALTAFVAVVLIVALHTFTAVRIYEASVRILIERDSPNVVSFQEVLEQDSLTDDYYETQYEILRGRGLARRTIEALDLWSHQQFNSEPGFSIRGFLMTPVDMVVGWLEPPAPVQPPEAEETSAQSAIIDQFLGSMNVSAVRFSRLVDVSFASPDPVLAAKVPNALALAYIQQSVELRSSTTKDASDFLTQQLDEQRKKVEESEQALQAYRESTGSVSLEERQNIVTQKLEDLNSAVTRANTVRIQKESIYNQVKAVQENPAAIDSLPLILSNTGVQQQKAELAQLMRQRAQLSEKLGPNHPDMVKVGIAISNAEAKIQAEVARVLEGARSEYEAALAEERTLSAGLNRQKQEAQGLNRAGIQYGVLQRDAEANRQMFEALLKRTQETGVSAELKAGNIRIVDQAETPQGPVSPNVFNNLMMALLGGLALGMGLAFAFEYADDRIKNPDEMKRQLGLPFLGMVPRLFDKTSTTPLVGEGVSSAFAESIRSIRTNVLFSCAEEGGRLIVITSSVPGEGKTAVASNLAVTLAQAGHRVLLMDADMRKPRVHEVFSRPVAPGLSNLLVGNAAASQAIQESKTPGLWLMPAGTSPPNPAELLGSKRFKDFTTALMQHYDWVIVDTPPIMAVTDASIVGGLAHGVLFVVGAEMTNRRVAQRAVEQLELGQAKFLGAVLNRVDLKHNAYYYSKYYRPDYGGYYGPPGGASGDSRAGATAGTVVRDTGAKGWWAGRIAARASARIAGGDQQDVSVPSIAPDRLTVTDAPSATNVASTTLTIARTETTTAVSSPVNPSTFGQAVTFTATVSGRAGGTPTGFVQFSDSGTDLGAPVPVSPAGTRGVASALLTTSELTAGSHAIQAAYLGDKRFETSRSEPSMQTVNKARPTVVVDAASVTYDGQPHPATGRVTGVGADEDLDGLSFTYNESAEAPVNAGAYVVRGSYAGSANYEAAASGATLTIERARPTIVVVDDAAFTYDGQPHAATGRVTGVVAGEDPGALSFTYNQSAETPVNAGDYQVIGSFAGTGNYTEGSAGATLTIRKATPTITVNDATCTYDGEPHAGTAKATGVGGVDLGALSFTYTPGPGAPVNAGTYIVRGSFAGAANYEAAASEATLTIERARPDVVVDTASVTYDGQPHAATGRVTGVGADEDLGALSFTYNESAEAPVNAGAYVVRGSYAGSANYEAAASGATLTIERARPTIVVVDDAAFTYDGQPHAATGRVTGVVAGEDLGALGFTYNQSAETPVNAGDYQVIGSFAGTNNYAEGSAGATLTIRKATPTITVNDAACTYDGGPHAGTGKATGVGGVDLGALSFTYTPGPAAPINAGTYIVRASYAGAANYEAAASEATLTIERARPTVVVGAASVTYDGKLHAATGRVTGVVAGEDLGPLSFAYDESAEAPVNAGTYVVRGSYAGTANYEAAASRATLTIEQARPTVIVDDAAFTYDGQPHAATGRVTGVVAGEDLGALSFTYNQSAETPVNAGAYQVIGSFPGSGNYAGASAGATLTIRKATPAITVNDATCTYDGEPHAGTGMATGVGGADLGALSFTYTPGPAAPVNAGTYVVRGSYTGTANYEAAAGGATLTIERARPAVVVDDAAFTYDGQPHAATGRVTGVVAGEDLGVLSFTYDQSAEAPINAGAYQVVGSFAGTSNYEGGSDGATLTIRKARPDVVVDDVSVTYDGQPHAATGRVTGRVSGEDLGALHFTYDQSAKAPVNAGVYQVIGSFAGTSNYEGGSDSTTLTIRKARPTVVVDAVSVTFDGQPHAATGRVTGVGAGEDLGGLSLTYEGAPTVPTDAGTYAVIGSYAASTNYESASDNATLTIRKARPTVVVDAVGATYDGQPHAATGRVTGAVAGEDLGALSFTYEGARTAPIHAGTYEVIGSYAGSANYEAASASTMLTIRKARPTVVVDAVSATYDGQPHGATGRATAGVAGGNLGTLSFTYEGSPTAPTHAGTYAVIGSYAGSANYEAASASTTLTIRKARPTVVVDAVSATCDGQPHAATGRVTGVVPGEDLGALSFTYEGVPAAPTHAGTYEVIGLYAGSADYESASASTTLTIRKARPTVVVDAVSATYDGQPHAATGRVTGVVPGEDLGALSFTYEGSPTAPIHAGTYAVIGSYAGSADYESASASATLTIRKARPTVVVDAVSTTYDGQPHAATGRVTGVVPGEDLGALSFTYEGAPTAPIHAGTYAVIGSYVGSANYESASASTTLTIHKTRPTVVVDAVSVTYDGQPHAATGRLKGELAGEDPGALSFTYNHSAEAPVNAGVYQVIGSFDDASDGATLTILKAKPTVAVDDASVVYDGQPHGANGRATGVLGEDLGPLSVTYNQSPDEPVDAGVYQVIGSFAGTSNYEAGSDRATLTILKAQPTVVVDDASVMYDGQPHEATGRVRGVVEGEDLGALSLTYNQSSEAPVNAGTYIVRGSYEGAANYEAAASRATLTIEQARPTVVVDDAAVTYDGQPHAATGRVTGVVAGEDLGALSFTYNQSAEAPIDAGTYIVRGSYPGAENYQAAASRATLTIEQARPTVVVDDAAFTYDGQPHAVTGRVTGLAGEDLGALSFTYNQSAQTPVNAGAYQAIGSFAGTGNYAGGSAGATLTIRKATPTITVEDATCPHDGQPHGATGRVTGIAGEDLGALRFTYTPGPGEPVNEGKYIVHGSYDGTANYEAAASGATLTIELARPPVAADDATSSHDRQPQAATGAVTSVDAVALEHADDRIGSPEEMKKRLGLPLLGVVPRLFDTTITAPLVTNGVSGAFAESFRTIQTNVLFSCAAGDGGRLVVITSSAPGEGKTMVATNLAATLAQAGHRVLLIDADMRKPRVHEVFSRAVAPGLSNLLLGNAAPTEAIQDSATPGLWLMPAGTSPANPAELLESKRFKDFTASLLKHFDWVIVDTPSMMAVADASIAATLAHGVVLVVGAETTSAVAQRAVAQLGQATLLGAVLNRVDRQRADEPGVKLTFEHADHRIKNPDEVKKHLGLPLFGTVPRLFDKTITTPLVSNGASSAFAESFRTIQTNVQFSCALGAEASAKAAGSDGRLIVVTSAVPGEGKTVVAANLAVTLAQAGHRVLLIDADMRKPRVHEVFSRTLAPGLSNLLVGSAAATEAIQESRTPGLWLIPAGAFPSNPAELLGSKRFRDLTPFLLQHFDWVIVDTPSVTAVTDASIAAGLAHGVLFVVGAEMTSRRVAQRAVEQLGQAKVLGAVLNQPRGSAP